MEVFDEEKTDPEKIVSDENIIGTGTHCLIALFDCWIVGILKFILWQVDGTASERRRNGEVKRC
jgi:hypothetical protein